MQAIKQSQPSGQLSFARSDNSTLVVRLSGDWHLRHGLPEPELVLKQLDTAPKPARLTFDAAGLHDWDSGLLTFLIGVSEICHKRNLPADWSPLPEGVRGLVALAEAVPEKTGARHEVSHTSFIGTVGREAISFAQGLALLSAGSNQYEYHLNLEAVARIWRGGCIIRAALLEDIRIVYLNQPGQPNLLMDAHLSSAVSERQSSLRWIVKDAVEMGISIPGFMAALAYFDGFRSAWLPANLIQAQRDYFGAHTYERVDAKGVFHTHWGEI